MTGSIPPSQAAEQSGFSLDTLRYHERIGLLDDIGRAPSGRRRFREEDLEWLTLLIEHDGQVRRRIAALQAERAHLQEKIGWYRSQLQADDAR
jgi:DNA-binding transcriptional MerR regulator